jgi:hypothetical protein
MKRTIVLAGLLLLAIPALHAQASPGDDDYLVAEDQFIGYMADNLREYMQAPESLFEYERLRSLADNLAELQFTPHNRKEQFDIEKRIFEEMTALQKCDSAFYQHWRIA